MGGLAGILGNPVLEQLFIYGVLGQVLGAAMAPFLTTLTNAAFEVDPSVPLTPADLALGVIRNIIPEADAAAQAAKSGTSAERFAQLVLLTGDAPAPEAMAIALRRGFVDAATYLRGIRQGRLRDEWADLIRELATEDPTPTVALLAELKGQADHATALGLYGHFGGNPDHYQLALDVEGAGPSPLEAATAARRGIIPWDGVGAGVTSFEQAVHESAYRNKWDTTFRALAVYLPPPRTISALVREGAVGQAEAAKLLAEHGVPADLIPAYLTAAHTTKTAKTRELSQATVEKLYADRLVTRAVAVAFLEALTYTAPEAELILETVDLAQEQRTLTAAHNRIQALFVGHKIDRTQAAAALAALGVDATGAEQLLTVWDHERAANVRRLTPAEIVAAFGIGLVDQAGAVALLESEGFGAWDAWALLSIHHKAALPGEPPMGALPPPAGP